MEEGQDVAKRIKPIVEWLKNPHNALLVAVLLIALIIRIYLYTQTIEQPLWYDEADYMATAKHWAWDIPYEINQHRPPLFQYLAAIGFMLGLKDYIIKFILVLLPSTALVYLVYLLGKEMYDKRVGLIAGALTAVSWSLLFWTIRYQPDFISMSFQVAAILFMWKFWKEGKTNLAIISGVLAGLGVHFKISGLLVPAIFCLFILVKDRMAALKKKEYYYFAGAFLLTILPYFIFSYYAFGTPFGAKDYATAVTESASSPFGWVNLKYYFTMTEGNSGYLTSHLLYFLFILGAILALKFLLYLDILSKEKEKCFDAGIFSLIALAAISAFYIFYIRATDDRWVFLWMPFIFMLVGNLLMTLYDATKKYGRVAATIIVISLVLWAGYAQFGHAQDLIDNKKTSYIEVKEAALWMKDNSFEGDRILTVSYPQTVYYSERNVTLLSAIPNATELDKFIRNNRPKFLTMSVFEYHEPWVYQWPSTQENNKNVSAARMYFADAQKTQPILIVYRIE